MYKILCIRSCAEGLAVGPCDVNRRDCQIRNQNVNHNGWGMPDKRLQRTRDIYKDTDLTKSGKASNLLPSHAEFNKRVKDFLSLHGLDENDVAHVEYAIDRITEVNGGPSKPERKEDSQA
ncbi:MAG TPA: hypothetical protein VM577_07040 [Anaerovoracaceae bacterium]|nr:hypothetical protein [Anaerovoracaceae bacterium]